MVRRQPWLFVAMVWPFLVLFQLSSSSGSYHHQSPLTRLSRRNSRVVLMVESLLFAFRHRGAAAAEGGDVSATESTDSSSDIPADDGTLTLSSVSAKIPTKDDGGVCNAAVPGISDDDEDDEFDDEEEEEEDENEQVFLRVTATGLMSVSSVRRKYMTIRVENMVRYRTSD